MPCKSVSTHLNPVHPCKIQLKCHLATIIFFLDFHSFSLYAMYTFYVICHFPFYFCVLFASLSCKLTLSFVSCVVPLLVSYWCCNKLPRIQWLKTRFVILQFWRSEVWHLSCWTKVILSTGLVPFGGFMGRSISLSFSPPWGCLHSLTLARLSSDLQHSIFKSFLWLCFHCHIFSDSVLHASLL